MAEKLLCLISANDVDFGSAGPVLFDVPCCVTQILELYFSELFPMGCKMKYYENPTSEKLSLSFMNESSKLQNEEY